ncbi:MAG TPA: hypothetical protein VM120_18575 [Bryobacteraceae bacterium]|nr:hypothetical protein [Bryobacteraceae bacterium]
MCLFYATLLCGQSPPDLDTVIQAVRKEFQAERSMEVMRNAYATDRYFTFPRFQETAKFLRKKLEA